MKILLIDSLNDKYELMTDNCFPDLQTMLKKNLHDVKLVNMQSLISTSPRPIQLEMGRYSIIDRLYMMNEYLNRYFKLFSADLIIANDMTFAEPINIPVVSVCQNPFTELSSNLFQFYGDKFVFEMSFNQLIQKSQLNQSKSIIAISQYVSDYLRRLGFNPKLINYFVDTDNFKPVERVKSDKPTALWAGGFTPKDGFHILSRLVRDHPNITWKIAFKIPARHKHILKNVEFVEYKNTPEFFSSADFFISTTQYEGFNSDALKAASCNIPIITSNIGWFYGNNDSKMGVVVERDNYDQYKQAVKQVLEGSFKPRESVISNGLTQARWEKEWLDFLKAKTF